MGENFTDFFMDFWRFFMDFFMDFFGGFSGILFYKNIKKVVGRDTRKNPKKKSHLPLGGVDRPKMDGKTIISPFSELKLVAREVLFIYK